MFALSLIENLQGTHCLGSVELVFEKRFVFLTSKGHLWFIFTSIKMQIRRHGRLGRQVTYTICMCGNLYCELMRVAILYLRHDRFCVLVRQNIHASFICLYCHLFYYLRICFSLHVIYLELYIRKLT